MSDIIESIGDVLVHTGKEIEKKTKEMTNRARIQNEIRRKEEFVNRRFIQIGRGCFESNSENIEYADIKETLEEIRELKEQMKDLIGKKVCQNCGKQLADDSLFCNYCGTELEEQGDEE